MVLTRVLPGELAMAEAGVSRGLSVRQLRQRRSAFERAGSTSWRSPGSSPARRSLPIELAVAPEAGAREDRSTTDH
jgi:hypothetical protein